MGRPMRPIDPAEGTVQEFATELRQLRDRAGRPTFRQLARRAHYSATTLSVACAGTGMPSLDVTLALVRACDGPEEYWQRRWHDVVATMSASPAARVVPAPFPPGRSPDAQTGSRSGRSRIVLILARTRLGRLAAAGLVTAASAVGIAIWAVSSLSGPASRSERPAVAGLARPALYIGVSPCDVGAVVLTQSVLRLPAPLTRGGLTYPAGTVLGVVALRYSPRCALAWTRFLPAKWLSKDPSGSVTIQSLRPADGATTTLTVAPIVAVEGDPLLTVPGCVLARANIHISAGAAAAAMTGCYP